MGNNAVDLIQELQVLGYIYSPSEVVINTCLAFLLGMFISFVYKSTHKGLSYSQSFMLTLVYVTIIVAIVMMLIGNNLARAFALVGALSIIRFRTVVKDTKDTAYVFLCLAAGMAAGTSSYFIGIFGVTFVAIIAFILDFFNYGTFYKSEFILIFRSDNTIKGDHYSKCLDKFTKTADLIHIQRSGDGQSQKLTFDIVMKKNIEPEDLVSELSNFENIAELSLVASKHDVDY
jgi:uncharacterized membrane protein YhiD involved in acid resistance